METPDWRGLISQTRSREISGIYSESFADLKQSFRWKRRGKICWWYSANTPHRSVLTRLLLLLRHTTERGNETREKGKEPSSDFCLTTGWIPTLAKLARLNRNVSLH